MNQRDPNRDESLAIGYCYAEQVEGLFMSSVVDYLHSDYIRSQNGFTPRAFNRGGYIAVRSGPRIAHARNDIVATFLEKTDCQWLLMIDSDVVFTPQDVENMFQAADPEERPIVTGVYYGGGPQSQIYPVIYKFVKQEEPDDPFVVPIVEYPENAVCKIDSAGAGFLLMHRDALQKIGDHFGKPYPWFAEGTVYNGAEFGEDFAFFIRARDRGYDLWCHTGVQLGHVKPQVIDRSTFKDQQSKAMRVKGGNKPRPLAKV